MTRNERQRYILLKIIRDSNVTFKEKNILISIWSSIWRYFGMKEANKIGLWILEINQEKGYIVIRCSHRTKEILITSLTLIKEINGKGIIFTPKKR